MSEIVAKQTTLSPSAMVRLGWRKPAAVLASAGLVAICAHIAIPLGFTPVPVTMQTFAVLLIGLIFSPGAAFASLALYLAEGAAGLPVFSPHGRGGIAQLLGPTGGYLISYPVAAWFTSQLYRWARGSALGALAGAAAGSVLILIAGAAWLGVWTRAPFPVVFHESITPFLLGDAFKVAAAASCAKILDSVRGRGRT